jgi:hypothetical protein
MPPPGVVSCPSGWYTAPPAGGTPPLGGGILFPGGGIPHPGIERPQKQQIQIFSFTKLLASSNLKMQYRMILLTKARTEGLGLMIVGFRHWGWYVCFRIMILLIKARTYSLGLMIVGIIFRIDMGASTL